MYFGSSGFSYRFGRVRCSWIMIRYNGSTRLRVLPLSWSLDAIFVRKNQFMKVDMFRNKNFMSLQIIYGITFHS